MGAEAYIHVRLVALSAAAGCVDAASFLGLGEVFPANQTGNTVLLGIGLGQGEWSSAGRSAVALGGFLAGVALAALVLRGGAAGWSRRIDLVLGIEALALVALAALWGPLGTVALIALAALAMGVQSAAARHVGVPGVSTTFVTGTLTRVAMHLAQRDIGAHERAPALTWALYLAGAVAGGALTRLWSAPGAMAAATLVVALSALPERTAAPRSRRTR